MTSATPDGRTVGPALLCAPSYFPRTSRLRNTTLRSGCLVCRCCFLFVVRTSGVSTKSDHCQSTTEKCRVQCAQALVTQTKMVQFFLGANGETKGKEGKTIVPPICSCWCTTSWKQLGFILETHSKCVECVSFCLFVREGSTAGSRVCAQEGGVQPKSPERPCLWCGTVKTRLVLGLPPAHLLSFLCFSAHPLAPLAPRTRQQPCSV